MRNICEIILNLDQWFCSCFKIILIYSSGGHLVYYEEHLCEIILNWDQCFGHLVQQSRHFS